MPLTRFYPGIFLSTLSLRRATAFPLNNVTHGRHFYPRSPYGERRLELFLYYQGNKISIHALLTESDHRFRRWPVPRNRNFYPRSPYGERLMDTLILADTMLFLSTLSLRRATCVEEVSGDTWACDFYPRSPYGERREKPRQTRTDTNFYPRSPYGERRPNGQKHINRRSFLSTLSVRRATVLQS